MTNATNAIDQNEANEIQGRLALWTFTLMECRRLLKLTSRAKSAATPEHFELQQERMRGLQDLGPKNAPPLPDDPDGLNAYQRFVKDNPQYYAFPTYYDCIDIAEHVLMYTIVAFCRIWTSGLSSNGKAKSNMDNKIKDLREKMTGNAFAQIAERQKFDILLNQLLEARHKIIAHADGSHANINFQEGLFLTLPNNVVHGIDANYFAECVERLLTHSPRSN